jgi:hypothetical protein
MPARTLNDFFAGFFMARSGSTPKVNMTTRLQKGQGKVKEIKVERELVEKKEVIVRHEISSMKWKRWNYEDFSRRWNKTYLTQERERILK